MFNHNRAFLNEKIKQGVIGSLKMIGGTFVMNSTMQIIQIIILIPLLLIIRICCWFFEKKKDNNNNWNTLEPRTYFVFERLPSMLLHLQEYHPLASFRGC